MFLKKIIDLRENYHRRLKLQGCIFKDAAVRSHRKTCRLFLTMTYISCNITRFVFLTRIQWSYWVLEKYHI